VGDLHLVPKHDSGDMGFLWRSLWV